MKIRFDTRFFQKRKFESRIIKGYFNSALKDFRIASENEQPEVIFDFSYKALIKISIALIAFYGYKSKSRTGHHIKIIEKASQILEDKDIRIIGDKMRKKRNLDLYTGGVIISQKETKEYLEFIKEIIGKTSKYLKSQDSLF